MIYYNNIMRVEEKNVRYINLPFRLQDVYILDVLELKKPYIGG